MLDPPEEQVTGCVRESRVVERCRNLVRIPTVTPYSGDRSPSGELEGQRAVASILADLGARVEEVPCGDAAFDEAGILAPRGRILADRPNIVGTFTLGSGTGPAILLDAHMDTVAVDHYRGDPFSAELRDGCIHGRGSSDDKSGMAAMLEAVSALLESGNTYHGTVICCSVVDEECDGAGRGSLSCIRHLPAPDVAVVLDGSCDSIFDGCTGVVTAEITVHGRAGHAALGNSVNAIEQAVKLFPAFERFRVARGARSGEFNLGLFHAGDHPANVPDRARLAMNIKTLLSDMKAAEEQFGRPSGRLVREFFERCIAEATEGDPFFDRTPPEVRWVKDVPAAEAGEEASGLLGTMREAWRDLRGEEPRVATLAGWGDMAHFMNAGIPAVGLGCGFPGAAHGAEEKVRVEDLVRTARIVALALHRLLSAPTPRLVPA